MSNQSQDDNIVRVFVSHRHEDSPIAEGLKSLLEPWGAGRLQLFLSEEITPGDDWLEWIHSHLETADLLLFLYTVEDARWDWCLYETGLFEGKGDGKLVVLHPPEIQRPRPLTHLQMIEITSQNVERFITDLYGTTFYYEKKSPSLNPVLAENTARLAGEMFNLFNRRTHFIERIRWLHIDLVLTLTSDERNQIRQASDEISAFEEYGTSLLNRTKIAITTNEAVYAHFGIATWASDLTLQSLYNKWCNCRSVKNFINIDWPREIYLQILRAIRNVYALEVQTPLKSGADSETWYLPVINRAHSSAGDTVWKCRLELYRMPQQGIQTGI